LTLSFLKSASDFQIWSPQLRKDFAASFDSSTWKKIIEPFGIGEDSVKRNRMLACLLELVAGDPIRTGQVCAAAHDVADKRARRNISNIRRLSLDSDAKKQEAVNPKALSNAMSKERNDRLLSSFEVHVEQQYEDALKTAISAFTHPCGELFPLAQFDDLVVQFKGRLPAHYNALVSAMTSRTGAAVCEKKRE
jgi:hypothetical protein